MTLELKQKRAGMRTELRVPIGLQYELGEGLGVQKVGVGLSRAWAVAGMFRIGGDRELFPHLEAHLELFGDLRQIPCELVDGWRPIERRIITHRAKEWLSLVEILAVFAKAFPGKGRFCILPQIDLSLPAFIGPGRGAEADKRRKASVSHRHHPP